MIRNGLDYCFSSRIETGEMPMSDDARYKSNRLAVDGGTPVRSTPLPWELPGAYFIDDEEKRLVTQVVEARSPFRFYGLDAQGMVDRLESEWCSTFGHKHALGVNSGSAAQRLWRSSSSVTIRPPSPLVMFLLSWKL